MNEISKIENYFNQEINQRKLCYKKLSKYVAVFDYINKILIVLSTTSGRVCIIFSVSVVGAPIGIAGGSFTFIFLTTRIGKNKKNKKKHEKILMLAKSKLNSIETLVSQTSINMEVTHEELITILTEKDKYEKMKEIFINVNEKLEEKTENMRLNSVNSST